MPAVDRQLLERARAGDGVAFGELIRPHVPSVRRFAYAFARNWSDADDLAQDALLKAFRAIAGFEGRSSLSTWLYSVTRNVCFDHQRGKQARGRGTEEPLDGVDDVDPPSPLPGPDRVLETKDDVEQLWRALKLLPSEFRVPLVLFEIEGLEYREIAKIEGVPIGTIRSRLSRARQQLEVELSRVEPFRPSRPGTEPGARSSNTGSARP
jgi:RNA polymerase sigma-70 factor, ECF subfamily